MPHSTDDEESISSSDDVSIDETNNDLNECIQMAKSLNESKSKAKPKPIKTEENNNDELRDKAKKLIDYLALNPKATTKKRQLVSILGKMVKLALISQEMKKQILSMI